MREPISYDDHLLRTATELYILRKYQYDIRYNAASLDYDDYVAGLQLIKKYQETWCTKGFLLDSPRDRSDLYPVFGDQVGRERQSIVKKVTLAIEQLHEYDRLCRIYKSALVNHCVSRDFALEELAFVLGANGATTHHLYYQSNFDHIDFDPKFVAAAGRYTEKVLAEHRRAGRISRTLVDLDAERERIDSMSASELFAGIQFEGFVLPEGMVALFTPDEILAELQATVPLDFLLKLRKLEYRSGSHIGHSPQQGGQDVDIVGKFIPEFRNGMLDHTRIEIYRPFFVPEGTADVEMRVARSFFLCILFHEIGHNALYHCSYDELKGWEDVMQADPVAVTRYVASSRNQNEDLGKKEDFADTFMLYLRHPALLKIVSSLRFFYMTDFFSRHLQTRQQDTFTKVMNLSILLEESAWQERGMSADDVRRLFLGSE